MNPVLEEMLRTGHAISESGKRIEIHSDVPQEEGRFLHKIVSQIKPRVSLEVGLGYGISTHFICDALAELPSACHIVIDPHQFGSPWDAGWEGAGLYGLKKAGYGKMIRFYNAPSHLVLPQLESEGVKIDFAFIDGWHTFDYALVDFFYIDRILRVGGIVAFDDTNIYSSLQKLCRFIVTNRAYSVFRCFTLGPGLRLSLKRKILRKVADFSDGLRSVLRPEFIKRDVELGLLPESKCTALTKESDDTRRWNFHREF